MNTEYFIVQILLKMKVRKNLKCSNNVNHIKQNLSKLHTLKILNKHIKMTLRQTIIKECWKRCKEITKQLNNFVYYSEYEILTSQFVISNLKDIDIIDTESGFIILKFNYFNRNFITYYLPTHQLECDYYNELFKIIKSNLN